jgi:hypothetical protein
MAMPLTVQSSTLHPGGAPLPTFGQSAPSPNISRKQVGGTAVRRVNTGV